MVGIAFRANTGDCPSPIAEYSRFHRDQTKVTHSGVTLGLKDPARDFANAGGVRPAFCGSMMAGGTMRVIPPQKKTAGRRPAVRAMRAGFLEQNSRFEHHAHLILVRARGERAGAVQEAWSAAADGDIAYIGAGEELLPLIGWRERDRPGVAPGSIPDDVGRREHPSVPRFGFVFHPAGKLPVIVEGIAREQRTAEDRRSLGEEALRRDVVLDIRADHPGPRGVRPDQVINAAAVEEAEIALAEIATGREYHRVGAAIEAIGDEA